MLNARVYIKNCMFKNKSSEHLMRIFFHLSKNKFLSFFLSLLILDGDKYFSSFCSIHAYERSKSKNVNHVNTIDKDVNKSNESE